MKRVGNLYHRIADPDNLRLAFVKAAKGKADRREVIRYRTQLDWNLARLRTQLLNHNPDIGQYRFFQVSDPKSRQICAASFPERVLHHAIMNICEPVLDSCAIHDSYACRKGKGQRKAVARAQRFSRKNEWYLKLDIRKYFDSIDHQVTRELLARRFKDRDLLELFGMLLSTYSSTLGRGKGVPIGNLISQHLANFYLGLMDHWLKEECRVRYYLRYMDDFLVLAGDRAELLELLRRIENFLEERLCLCLKNNIQLNRCVQGIPFLGYRVFPGTIRLGVRSKKRFVRKFKEYEKKVVTGIWDEKILVRHLEPLIDFTMAAGAASFRRHVINRHGVSL